MTANNLIKAKMILIVYLIATLTFLVLGYSVRKPTVEQQAFPFTITYSFQGETKTISGTFVGEYVRTAKYLGDDSVAWYGYIQDHDRLETDFYRIGKIDGHAFSINLNIEPGYLMGDPKYADSVCQPSGVCHSFDGTNDITVTNPEELAQLGLTIVNWKYPEPIENTFSFGGVFLSSEATMYTVIIAMAALLACIILIKKDGELTYRKLDKVSIVLNFLVTMVAFPFIYMLSVLSEILGDTSLWQQLLYVAPALTLLGIGASVTLRRLGFRRSGFWSQFVGPAVFLWLVLLVTP